MMSSTSNYEKRKPSNSFSKLFPQKLMSIFLNFGSERQHLCACIYLVPGLCDTLCHGKSSLFIEVTICSVGKCLI